ncbi:MAG: alpha/beta hydrolase [Candidatus Pelagibacter sp.]|nr:alpha/beta hydrolase [Candidatus Pelagibacter sp.]OUU60533.1 MAG: alpha/beta hydrolase [Proteobacteria bacterium TMED61]|tara:strand:+ start:2356 stop:3150 length:795 start_codon:yes stop_codon:yes gene_type:complete
MSKTSDLFETYYMFNKVNETDPIIFIHGVGLDHRIWDDQIKYFKNYNTIVYDLIGHGKTSLKKDKITMKDFSNQLLKLANDLKIDKFHLIGFSLGSLIARDFASLHNNRLSSLTIFGTVYKRTEEQKRAIISRYEMMKLKKDITKKRALSRWFTETFIQKNPEIYKKIYSMLENTNFKTWLKVYKLFVYHEDNDDNIKQIKANTLVVTGKDDIGSKPIMSEKLSELIKGSKYKTIDKGKHLCNIECAEAFNKMIKKFIDSNKNV